ncbi:MAG: NAD(P)-dependent oxidoreductase [Rhodovulum sp.]|nr:NAD(P)-dependent oxidoreductase [Rhodovulum sp.]
MPITIAILAPGEMGAAVGARLVAAGARVTTSLSGRSPATAARAQAAGLAVAEGDAALVAEADIVLSIVPPGEAVAVAKRLRPELARAGRKPVYVDFNAVSPDTVRHIAAALAGTGSPFVDGSIIGPPPGPGRRTVFHVAGAAAPDVAKLRQHGLDVRVLEGPVGAASALKMSYSGITKGLTAIGAAMVLGATRAGCAADLAAELAESQPHLAGWLGRQVPAMFPKAYRFVAEMEEIADFLHTDRPSCEIYHAMARLYARLAAADGADEIDALARFCATPGAARPPAVRSAEPEPQAATATAEGSDPGL